MNKSYIISILNNTNMIHRISKCKTQYGRIINNFYFFRIFTDAFNSFGIDLYVDFSANTIIFSKGLSDYLKIEIDIGLLSEKITKYNDSMEVMGFLESTMKLREIFIELLL